MNRTKTELKIKLDNLVKPNDNNEITAVITNDILTDFLDSLQSESGVTNAAVFTVNQVTTSPNIVSTNTNIVNIYQPKGEISIFINGIKYQIGSSMIDSFCFIKDGINQDKNNILSNSTLYYNSSALGFTLDINDIIELNYIH